MLIDDGEDGAPEERAPSVFLDLSEYFTTVAAATDHAKSEEGATEKREGGGLGDGGVWNTVSR